MATSSQTLAELGVILLMFSLGIEFSLSKLLRVGPTAGFVAIVQCSLMMWLGYVAGQAFGWSQAGKPLRRRGHLDLQHDDHRQGVRRAADQGRLHAHRVRHSDRRRPDRDPADHDSHDAFLGRRADGHASLASAAGRLAAFLALADRRRTADRAAADSRRRAARSRRKRRSWPASASRSASRCWPRRSATRSRWARFSPALSSPSRASKRTVEHLVQPVRDIFAAIFFVSVGMLIDPAQIAAHWPIVLVFLVVVVVGNIFAVTLGAFLTGQSVQTSVKTGMSLAQIGEFSFIIAGVGVATGATDDLLYSIAVAVSGITTLLTPWLIRAAEPTAAWVDRKLPRSLQTFAALYGSWLEQSERWTGRRRNGSHSRRDPLADRRRGRGRGDRDRRIGRNGPADCRVGARTICTCRKIGRAWPSSPARRCCAAPFSIGMIRVARVLGFELASRAFPAAGASSSTWPPRRAGCSS